MVLLLVGIAEHELAGSKRAPFRPLDRDASSGLASTSLWRTFDGGLGDPVDETEVLLPFARGSRGGCEDLATLLRHNLQRRRSKALASQLQDVEKTIDRVFALTVDDGQDVNRTFFVYVLRFPLRWQALTAVAEMFLCP